MTWNYRIVKHADGTGFGLHRVYYDKQGNEESMGFGPATFVSDTKEGLTSQLVLAKTDARKRPVFEEPEDWA